MITLSGQDGEGVLSEIGFVIDDTSPELVDFAAKFRTRAGFSPNMMMTCAYDAMNMLAAAMANCSVLDRATIRNELFALKGFEGLTGAKAFNEDRTITQRNFKILTIENSKWKVLTGYDYIN
jgi:ABC-type branched-subunit amino acid transport system substrate-binding protein